MGYRDDLLVRRWVDTRAFSHDERLTRERHPRIRMQYPPSGCPTRHSRSWPDPAPLDPLIRCPGWAEEDLVLGETIAKVLDAKPHAGRVGNFCMPSRLTPSSHHPYTAEY